MICLFTDLKSIETATLIREIWNLQCGRVILLSIDTESSTPTKRKLFTEANHPNPNSELTKERFFFFGTNIILSHGEDQYTRNSLHPIAIKPNQRVSR